MTYMELRRCPIHGVALHDVTFGARGSDREIPPPARVECQACRRGKFNVELAAKPDERAA